MTSTARFCSVSLLAAIVFCAAQAISKVRSKHHSLHCGEARFEIMTSYVPGSDVPRQTMHVHRPDGSTTRVDLRIAMTSSKAPGHPALEPTSFVEEWKCRRTRKRTFVDLEYACNGDMSRSDTDAYCKGWSMKEWDRYVGLEGRHLDRGFDIEDPRYRQLEKALGLPDYYDGRTYKDTMTSVD